MIEFEYDGMKIKVIHSDQNYFTHKENDVEIGIKVDNLYDSTRHSSALVSTSTLKSQRIFLLQEAQKNDDYMQSELNEFNEMARAITDILTERGVQVQSS